MSKTALMDSLLRNPLVEEKEVVGVVEEMLERVLRDAGNGAERRKVCLSLRDEELRMELAGRSMLKNLNMR